MKEWIKDIVIAVVVALIVIQFIRPNLVKESSMEPSFYENDYLFISKQSYKLFGEPERGDVVVFHSHLTSETGQEKLLIKRVIGLPGETIDISEGKVYINGEELIEDYIKEGTTTGEVDSMVIPEDSLFCMGDNRRVSIDSRDPDVGCVRVDDIYGKAVFRAFPFSEFGIIKNPYDN